MLEETGESFSSLLIYLQSSIIKPFSYSLPIGLFVLLILVICSALISGSEVAFFSLKKTDIDEMRNAENRKDKLIFSLLQKPKKLLATILIANNFINIAIVILSTYIISKTFSFGDYELLAFFIEVVAVTSLILLFGEIMPKVYATEKAKSFAAKMSPTLYFINRLASPLSLLLVSSTSFIDKRIEKKGHEISKDELSEAIDITTHNNSKKEEKQMLKGIVHLGNTEVSEIMKSRVDVTAVEQHTRFHELLALFKESGFSRIPVYEKSFDNVSGLVYIKDLIPYLDKAEDFDWTIILRPAFFVPENKRINDLLSEFKKKKIHMAIVVDEYGGTSGIVTMEDILEEIVGDINDEFDTEEDEKEYQKINNNTYIFDGRTSIIDVCRIINQEYSFFEEIKGEADSLAGLLLEIKGNFPGFHEEIKYKNFVFKVIQLSKRRIKKIKLTINTPKKDDKNKD
jgi:gliding motility-associated protein GldE